MKSKWQWAGLAGATLTISQPALAEYAYPLHTPVSQAAQTGFQLNNFIMLMCLGIFIAVFTAIFFSLLKHRKSAGNRAVHFHENTMVEVIWTAIPFLILVGMAYPATKTIIEHHAAGEIQLDEQQVASR